MKKAEKFVKGVETYEKIKSPIQWIIYGVIGAAVIATIIGLIFGTKSCKTNSTIETVEAKYFIGDNVTVHDNYQIKIYYAKTVDSIEYKKSKADTEKTISKGNYIEVNLDITKLDNSTEKNHKLDENDFKLRDHSGVYLPLNDILSVFDINAMDLHIDTDENGFVNSKANFDNKNAVKDYTWYDFELQNGETKNLTLYFYLKEGYKVERDLMLLEVDLYWGKSGIKKGEDIVLAWRKDN